MLFVSKNDRFCEVLAMNKDNISTISSAELLTGQIEV